MLIYTCFFLLFSAFISLTLPRTCNLPCRKTKEAHEDREKCAYMATWNVDDVDGRKSEKPYYKKLIKHVEKASTASGKKLCLLKSSRKLLNNGTLVGIVAVYTLE